MKAKCLVASVNNETWFAGQKDERQVVTLNLLDADAHLGKKIKQTFDYTPSQDEAKELDLPALDMQMIVIAVSEISAGAGGRLKIRGEIDRSALPKQSLRAAGSSPSPTTTKTS